MSQLVLTAQSSAEHIGIVGIQRHQHSGIEELAQRMLLNRGTTACQHIAGDADFDGNLLLGEIGDECGVFASTQTVTNAIGVQVA